MNNRKLTDGALTRRNALTVALAVGLGFTGVAFGQATSGTIFGTAPAAAGQTVSVTGNGVSRTVSVSSDGRYTVANLPVGTYTVTLSKDGQSVNTRSNINISVGAGTEVDFAAKELGTVQVNDTALPSIDVSTVTSTTIITASDLEKLPVGRSAESIALLAPNTVAGSSYFGNLVSFGGSGVAENAYYVNGFNTGDPFKNLGGFSLPYGAIAQQQTITGGYGAKYGRSDGGVINQVGKRGTNDWHFGGQVAWAPEFLSEPYKNQYYAPAGSLQPNYVWSITGNNPGAPGTLYRYGKDRNSWQTIYSAYVGGPLIKDKLFFFAAVEQSKTAGTTVTATNRNYQTFSNHNTKYYGKLDWNINDNNILEATVLKQQAASGSGATYGFDANTLKRGAFIAGNDKTINNAKYLIAHYTSYISDNATLSVLWGKGSFFNPTILNNTSTLPYISNPTLQNPAYNGGTPITNDQTNIYNTAQDAADRDRGLRADFTYVLGEHTLGVGIDNMSYTAHNQGRFMSGPGYIWSYQAGGAVRKYEIADLTSMNTQQKAYYLQDTWQATPNLQLDIGVRNDHYINNNDLGVAFVNMKNQWEPRLGFSWDVNGDSSFKVYGNAGRYYLALPNSVAKRAANRSTFIITQYGSYSGINPDGSPSGLPAPLYSVSPDGEYGTPKDAKQVSASDLRPQYIDEFIVGFDKQFNSNWTYGAKAMYRKLGTAIDDECNPYAIAHKMGITSTAIYSSANYAAISATPYKDSLLGAAYCRLINPGQSNNILVKNSVTNQYVNVTMNQSDWGYVKGPKRTYASLNLYLEHPFDGKWFGRVDYTYTYAHGNTAGQTRPDFGQADISKTEDWDYWQLMQGQDGQLLNSREHVVRFRGAYQITPEWLVSGTALIQSGVPQECLGYYGPNQSDPTLAGTDPTGYGPNYHWCNGQIVHPGSGGSLAGHTPWTENLNIGVRYTPNWGDKKLSFKFDVYNLLNQQRATQTDPILDAGQPNPANTPNVKYQSTTFHQPISVQAPRYVRLSVSYDY